MGFGHLGENDAGSPRGCLCYWNPSSCKKRRKGPSGIRRSATSASQGRKDRMANLFRPVGSRLSKPHSGAAGAPGKAPMTPARGGGSRDSAWGEAHQVLGPHRRHMRLRGLPGGGHLRNKLLLHSEAFARAGLKKYSNVVAGARKQGAVRRTHRGGKEKTHYQKKTPQSTLHR